MKSTRVSICEAHVSFVGAGDSQSGPSSRTDPPVVHYLISGPARAVRPVDKSLYCSIRASGAS